MLTRSHHAHTLACRLITPSPARSFSDRYTSVRARTHSQRLNVRYAFTRIILSRARSSRASASRTTYRVCAPTLARPIHAPRPISPPRERTPHLARADEGSMAIMSLFPSPWTVPCSRVLIIISAGRTSGTLPSPPSATMPPASHHCRSLALASCLQWPGSLARPLNAAHSPTQPRHYTPSRRSPLRTLVRPSALSVPPLSSPSSPTPTPSLLPYMCNLNIIAGPCNDAWIHGHADAVAVAVHAMPACTPASMARINARPFLALGLWNLDGL